jgi:ankyrin repeat protein
MMTTLLSIAVANGHLKTVQLLLDKGAEVDWFSGPVGDLLQSNSRGAPNFPNRQMFGDENFLAHFSAPVVQTADKDKGGMSALLCAIWFGDDKILKLLLNYRALFEADESQRAWALDLACQNYRPNTALMLFARHSREWTETTDGLIFKLDTLKKIEGFGGVDISRMEGVNILVWMEVRRRREEMESWMERPA